jgi:hypothetical protein
MRPLLRILLVAAAIAVARPAGAAKPGVVWTEISMPSAQARPDLERHLRDVVVRQARLLDWGRRGDAPVEAKIEVTEFSAVTKDGVVRVTCAGHGRISDGHGTRVARSRFSMGGRPSTRTALERQLLTMLGRGLVTRLADIARNAQ